MSRYVQWDDVVKRYRIIETQGGANQVGSSYIDYAEAFIEGKLAGSFTVPFSSNNITVKDLIIDAVYMKSIRFSDTKKSKVISEDLKERIKALISGECAMMTDDGISMYSTSDAPFSTTENYHPTFGMGPIEEMTVDHDRIEDEEDERDGDYWVWP